MRRSYSAWTAGASIALFALLSCVWSGDAATASKAKATAPRADAGKTKRKATRSAKVTPKKKATDSGRATPKRKKGGVELRMKAVRRLCIINCVYMRRSCRRWSPRRCRWFLRKCVRECNHRKLQRAAATRTAHPQYGRSKKRAIRVCTPSGERRYLYTLRCADGSRPRSRRAGSVGFAEKPKKGAKFRLPSFFRLLKKGEPDTHIIDLYLVSCPKKKKQRLYFDMYHCLDGPKQWAPPRGFRRPLKAVFSSRRRGKRKKQ